MAESLLHRFKKTTRLPSPPGTAMEILRLCQQEDVEINELADTVAADPAISLRLLKYANSPLVAPIREITSVRDAIILMGVRSVRLMALSFSLVSTNDQNICRGFDYAWFWSQSVAHAVAARALANLCKKIPPEEAFIVGLLCEVGRLVFASCASRDYAGFLKEYGHMPQGPCALESRHMGGAYDELGADLLRDWGISVRLADAVRCQNRPEELQTDATAQRLAYLIGAARAIASMSVYGGQEPSPEEMQRSVQAIARFVTGDQMKPLLEKVAAEYKALARLLSLSVGTAQNAEEIQATAGEVLEELSLAAQLKSETFEKENRSLQEQAYTDALTGVNNRMAFEKKMHEQWFDCMRKQRSIGLIMIDVDHFKRFNDTFGHQCGDAVLQAVGKAIPQAVRGVDFVARYGGEEFVVIMPNIDRMIGAQICVKIRVAIERMCVEHEGGGHKVTASVGAAILPCISACDTPEKLIEAADRQLYRAKEKGRNCCCMKQFPVPQPLGV